MLFATIELSKIDYYIKNSSINENLNIKEQNLNKGISHVSSFAISLLNLAKINLSYKNF